MKRIKDFQNSEIKRTSLSAINGGNHSPTGKNANGQYTDVWEDSNGDGRFGVGDMFCFVEPYDVR
ncbi:hypothetical protein [Aquimarina sp. SS2-1]|uniref:hypothetical protein n=1 Tax=Aquimarina besae TaxID=3342247 RepID=UPI00366D7D8C